MILNLFVLIAGFALLVKGADYLVEGATDIARRFHISTLVIGLTVVAFGTSAPELAVNVISAFNGSTDIALGNINGSNIANTLLVLGIVGLFTRIPVQSRTVIKEIPFMMLSGVVLVFIMMDVALDGDVINQISRIDGIVLLLFFSIFMYYLFLSIKGTQSAKKERAKRKMLISILFIIGGLLGLIIGGQLTVDSAIKIATAIGMSESFIALTIVAIGTSLPELVTAVVAARKGDTDMAVGNVVGSNIFNILMVLGITSTIVPIPVTNSQIIDSVFVLVGMLVLLLAVWFGKDLHPEKHKDVSKKESAVMLLMYLAYIIFISMRG